jgi:flagellar motility protein MotE (MotC chaperone)
MGKEVNLQNSTDNNEKHLKHNKLLSGLTVLVSAFLLIAAIMSGTYYFIIHKNYNGVADKYRDYITRIPVIRHALPDVPEFEDPSQYTYYQLVNRYRELQKSKNLLENEYKNKTEESESLKKEVEALKRQLTDASGKAASADKLVKQAEEDMKKANEIIESANNSENDAKKFIELYEAIDPAVTARIFEQIGDEDIDLIARILMKMKKDVSAEIISNMDVKLLAKLTNKLSALVARK